MENTTISITFNGTIDNDNSRWMQWYNDAKEIVRLLGYEPTHVGVSGSAFKSGKVLNLSKNEKKICRSIENGDSVQYISLFSLPKDYKSASFDYDVFIARDEGYVTLTMNQSTFAHIQEDELLNMLRKHICVHSGEIYEMDRDEVPLLYAAKDNATNMFNTLRIIKTIN
ncbi:MAG: hypothetical protein IKL53_03685 [Lachnospiraceae bacterium]|nr:hypothetical protein [Lachnospiraceae bacterium]